MEKLDETAGLREAEIENCRPRHTCKQTNLQRVCELLEKHSGRIFFVGKPISNGL